MFINRITGSVFFINRISQMANQIIMALMVYTVIWIPAKLLPTYEH